MKAIAFEAFGGGRSPPCRGANIRVSAGRLLVKAHAVGVYCADPLRRQGYYGRQSYGESERITFSEAIMPDRGDNPIPSNLPPLMERAQAEGALRSGQPENVAAHLINSLVSLPTAEAMLGSSRFDDLNAMGPAFQKTWERLL